MCVCTVTCVCVCVCVYSDMCVCVGVCVYNDMCVKFVHGVCVLPEGGRLGPWHREISSSQLAAGLHDVTRIDSTFGTL